jgi:pregnancy-associated plasma protein-A
VIRRTFLFAVVFFVCALIPVVAPAEDFRIAHDGSIRVSGLSFSDSASYLRSDFFRDNGMRCGTKAPPVSTVLSAVARSVSHCTSTLTSIQAEYWPSPVTYIMPVWFHVIYKSNGYGYVTDARINAQMEVMNEDYAAMAGTLGANGYNTRIQFELAGITRTINDVWFDTDDEFAYKPALNKDPSQYINIYTSSAGGYLGYSYFPQDSAGMWWDGIVLLHDAVGGRYNGFYQYDQGRTLVHEMGHYLGLYHTFGKAEGSCENTYTGGDLIVDTPAEGTIHYGCTQTVTCSSLDPIHNYMSYTDDICMEQFSREQANRAVCSLVNYRPATYRRTPAGGFVPAVLTPLLLRN